MPELRRPPKPYWSTSDGETVRLYHGHAPDVLAGLPEKSVHCCVTSPPYWGLRDYGVSGQLGAEPSPDCKTGGQAQCGGCFVCSMVNVFRAVRRVLRDDGTLWLNLGDSYCGGMTGGNVGYNADGGKDGYKQARQFKSKSSSGLPPGNLVGVPWRVALALQGDGWVLRQDVIWHKPAPMPESVRNRCTKAHEYVFLLTKRGGGYYCDMEAIKEKASTAGLPPRTLAPKQAATEYDGMVSHNEDHAAAVLGRVEDRNKRSVWSVSSQGYAGAHFATFPPRLIEPMIKAGTSERGCCRDCGAPWKRMTEETTLTRDRPNDYVKRTGEAGTGNSCPNSAAGVDVRTVGWEPTCKCPSQSAEDYQDNVVPCTVLDPFVGSGTTCEVALVNDRYSIGIDLSEKYLRDNAADRLIGVMSDRPHYARLIPRGK